jgi:hypothetical protein
MTSNSVRREDYEKDTANSEDILEKRPNFGSADLKSSRIVAELL